MTRKLVCVVIIWELFNADRAIFFTSLLAFTRRHRANCRILVHAIIRIAWTLNLRIRNPWEIFATPMTRLVMVQNSRIWTQFCGFLNFASVLILYTTILVSCQRDGLIFRSTITITPVYLIITSVSELTCTRRIKLRDCQFPKDHAAQQTDWHFHDCCDIFVS